MRSEGEIAGGREARERGERHGEACWNGRGGVRGPRIGRARATGTHPQLLAHSLSMLTCPLGLDGSCAATGRPSCATSRSRYADLPTFCPMLAAATMARTRAPSTVHRPRARVCVCGVPLSCRAGAERAHQGAGAAESAYMSHFMPTANSWVRYVGSCGAPAGGLGACGRPRSVPEAPSRVYCL